jgi:hypothetical protein
LLGERAQVLFLSPCVGKLQSFFLFFYFYINSKSLVIYYIIFAFSHNWNLMTGQQCTPV